MQQQFELVLQNEKLKLYQRIGWLIISILLLIYIYFSFFSGQTNLQLRGTVFIIAMGIAFGLKQYLAGTKYRFGITIFFYFLAAAFFANNQYLPGGITLFFQLLHFISTRAKIIKASNKVIIYPSFPAKSIGWDQLNNAILKDGLITFDFKNDKIIQQLLDENKSSVNEAEFNEFCRQQLKK